MPLDSCDREANMHTARRRLADVLARGAGYPKGHEPALWLESYHHAQAKAMTAERLYRESVR